MDILENSLPNFHAFLAKKQFHEAELVLEQLLARTPNDHALLGEKARLAVAQKRFQVAIEIANDLIEHEIFSVSEEAAVAICRAYRTQHLYDDVQAFAEKGLTAFPHSASLLAEMAEVHMARRNWREATKTWKAALELFGQSAPASLYRKYSAASLNTGASDEAKKVLAQGLQAHPKSVLLLRTFISQAMSEGDFEAGADYLRTLVAIEQPRDRLRPVDVIGLIICAQASKDVKGVEEGTALLKQMFPDDRNRSILLDEVQQLEFGRDDNSILLLPPELITEQFPTHLAFKALLIRLRRGSRGLSSFPVLTPVDYEYKNADWIRFQIHMKENLNFFANTLNSRFMLSVVDTYTDFSIGEDRAVSLMIANILVSERNFYTLRCVYDLTLKTKPILDKQIAMWDGFQSNRLAGDDVYKVWLNRHDSVLEKANPVLAVMFYRLFALMVESGTSSIALNCEHSPGLKQHAYQFIERFEKRMVEIMARAV